MSDSCWIKVLVGGFLILIINISYCTGVVDDCSFCCVVQGKSEDLNCTWSRDTWTPHVASLHSRPNSQHPPQYFTLLPGQSWLILPRRILTDSKKYQLRLPGGDSDKTLNFTYRADWENVFIRPPILNSSFSEDDKSIEVIWDHPLPEDLSHPLLVDLRYRIQGASNWIVVNENELEHNIYQLDDPEPYTTYEFQIRYLPDKKKKDRGSQWSESYVTTTPEDVPNGTLDIWRSLKKGPSLLIMWKPLNPRSARGKILSYHLAYVHGTKSETIEAPCCNKTMPAHSTDVCVSARNSKGLGPSTCVTPLCSDTALFGGKAWGDAAGRINVWWEEPLNSSHPLSYLVEWREVTEDGNTEIHWTRSQTANRTLVLPGEFTPGVLHRVSVFTLYNNNCVADFSTETYSQEEVPSAAPNFTIHVLTSTEVVISWDEILMQHQRGTLTHYTIYLNSTGHCQQHRVHSGNKTFSGLTAGMVYSVWMTAFTTAGEGKPGVVQTFQTRGARSKYYILGILSLIFLTLILVGTFSVWRRLFMTYFPRIPEPQDKFKVLCTSPNNNVWEHQQDLPNSLIMVVEEIEPPPPPPPEPSSLLPNRFSAISSGYEKHFMPTQEEVMGLC